jgi:hypothetical protein
MLTREANVRKFSDALGKGVGSAVAFCLAVTVIWPVGALLVYHMRVSDPFFFFGRSGTETDREGLASLPQCYHDRTGRPLNIPRCHLPYERASVLIPITPPYASSIFMVLLTFGCYVDPEFCAQVDCARDDASKSLCTC